MATREENLKKINDELNKLSDEDLDKVAGGTVGDTAEDSKLLYNYGLVDDWHGRGATGFYWGSYSAAVDEGWAKAGITCCTVPFGANKYWLDGKQISRDEAIAHLKKPARRFTKNTMRTHNLKCLSRAYTTYAPITYSDTTNGLFLKRTCHKMKFVVYNKVKILKKSI